MRLGGLGTVALQLAFGYYCVVLFFFIGFKWKLGELGLRLFNQPFISLIYHINVIKITGISKKKKFSKRTQTGEKEKMLVVSMTYK
jgi:hypothetical protein